MSDQAGVSTAADMRLGAVGLLRVASVPGQAWLDAGNPALFTWIRAVTEDTARRTRRGRQLARQLGDIVPDVRLTDRERHAVLALRRRLHAGAPPNDDACAFLHRMAAVPTGVAEEAASLGRAAQEAAEVEKDLGRALCAERARLGDLAVQLAQSNPLLTAFVESSMPGLLSDVTRRLADGAQWSGKQMRKRQACLWRVAGRAAFKTTPRDWACQVAVIPVHGPGERLLPEVPLGALTATVCENVHLATSRLSVLDLRQAEPHTLLAPAPLHFGEPDGDGGRLRCYVIDPGDPGRLRDVCVRRTRLLDSMLSLFAEGPRTLADLERACAGDASREVLRGFLAHLVRLGIVRLCTAPRVYGSSWVAAHEVDEAAALPCPLPAPASRTSSSGRNANSWFLDSYRTVDAAVSEAAADRIERGLAIAARLARLRQADRLASDALRLLPAGAEALDEHPRPLGALLGGFLTAHTTHTPPRRRGRYTGWHSPLAPDSGYARLLTHLSAVRSDHQVDIDHALLDSVGAPPARTVLPAWPLDCLLRPLPGATATGTRAVAVLETASPAGVLDARFAEALHCLHGGYDPVEAYRAFLAEVEDRAGVRFVELLVPPVIEQAANTVRRPALTRWWTGDSYRTIYCPPGGPSQNYLPLDRITLRREPAEHGPDAIIAEADGQRILPIHHATRSPMPPYDRLLPILLSAGHPDATTVIRLDGLAAALPSSPGVIHAPRLTAGADLVIGPQSWRVPRRLLWEARDSEIVKIRCLNALRNSANLPRFVFARTADRPKPMPLDLESALTPGVVDRMCASQGSDELLLEEMLPEPARLPLRDPVHQGAAVAAQLLLRTPWRMTPRQLAQSAAARLTRIVPGPPAPRAAAAGAANT